MRAYRTIRFTENCDVLDIRAEGRASHVGKVAHDEHGYIRSGKAKAAIRRSLKRSDRARALRLDVE